MRLKYTRTRVTEQHVGTQSLRENVLNAKSYIVLEETIQNRNGIKKSYRPVPPFMQFAAHCFPHARTTFPSSSASNPKPNLFFWSLSYFFVASRQLLRHAASQLGAISAAVSTFSNGCAVTSHALKSSSSSSSSSVFVGLPRRDPDDVVSSSRGTSCVHAVTETPRVRPTIRPASSYLFTLYSFETSP